MIDLDQTQTHKQYTIHYITHPKQFLVPTDKVTPTQDVSTPHHAQDKAPTKTAVRERNHEFLKDNKRLTHDLVD